MRASRTSLALTAIVSAVLLVRAPSTQTGVAVAIPFYSRENGNL